jgi:hypothetical protein
VKAYQKMEHEHESHANLTHTVCLHLTLCRVAQGANPNTVDGITSRPPHAGDPPCHAMPCHVMLLHMQTDELVPNKTCAAYHRALYKFRGGAVQAAIERDAKDKLVSYGNKQSLCPHFHLASCLG